MFDGRARARVIKLGLETRVCVRSLCGVIFDRRY
jgi:hypothetical protein